MTQSCCITNTTFVIVAMADSAQEKKVKHQQCEMGPQFVQYFRSLLNLSWDVESLLNPHTS